VTLRRRRRQQGGQGQVGGVDDDSYNLLQPSPLCCAWRGETRAGPPRLPSAAVHECMTSRRPGGGTVCRPLATNRNTGHLLLLASHRIARRARALGPCRHPCWWSLARAARPPSPSLLVGLVFVCSAGAGLRARTRLAVAGYMASLSHRRLFKFDRKRLAPRDA
jgi:hypothetical protein